MIGVQNNLSDKLQQLQPGSSAGNGAVDVGGGKEPKKFKFANPTAPPPKPVLPTAGPNTSRVLQALDGPVDFSIKPPAKVLVESSPNRQHLPRPPDLSGKPARSSFPLSNSETRSNKRTSSSSSLMFSSSSPSLKRQRTEKENIAVRSDAPPSRTTVAPVVPATDGMEEEYDTFVLDEDSEAFLQAMEGGDGDKRHEPPRHPKRAKHSSDLRSSETLCEATPPPETSLFQAQSTASAELHSMSTEQLTQLLVINQQALIEALTKLSAPQSWQDLREDPALTAATRDFLTARNKEIQAVLDERRRNKQGHTGDATSADRSRSFVRSMSSAHNDSLAHMRQSNPIGTTGLERVTSSSAAPMHMPNGAGPSMPDVHRQTHTSFSNGAPAAMKSTIRAAPLTSVFDDDDILEVQGYERSVQTASTARQAQPAQSSSSARLQGVSPPKAVERPRKSVSAADQVDQTATPWYEELSKALKNVFHLTQFRPNQLQAINATMAGKDVYVLMPTGGGKSLCYQLPAVCKTGKTKGVTVVVSPLLALMTDQVQHCRNLGIDVVMLNSDVSRDEARDAESRLRSRNKPALCYITPEGLEARGSLRSLLSYLHKDNSLARFVIDEAHCVSQWGFDFRPAYEKLGMLRKEYPGVPIMALTATANNRVSDDIIGCLGMRGCVRLSLSFNRPNLHYSVRKKPPGNLVANIFGFINSYHRNDAGIIYCLSRKKCEEVANELRTTFGLPARHYHAGMSKDDRLRTQEGWKRNDFKVIVATIAFGMGIDKPDVRYVIHHSLPKSLEGYYQETGRAGRDGKDSVCILYYHYGDTAMFKKFIDESDASPEQKERQRLDLQRVVQYCQNITDCRRTQVLQYFDEDFSPENCHKTCDNCMSNEETMLEDVSELARKALKTVQSVIRSGRVTLAQAIDIFRGANTAKVRQMGWDKLETFGAGAGNNREQIERLYQHLVSHDAIREQSIMNRGGFNTAYLNELGPLGYDILNRGKPFMMRVQAVQPVTAAAAPRAGTNEKKRGGKVKAVNKSAADDSMFIDNGYDFEDERIEEVNDADDIEAGDEDSFALQGQGSKAIAAKSKPIASRTRRKTVARDDILGGLQGKDKHELCLAALEEEIAKIAIETHVSDTSHILSEEACQLLAAQLPGDAFHFRQVLEDCLGHAEDAKKIWDRYGRRLLTVCIRFRMLDGEAALTPPRPRRASTAVVPKGNARKSMLDPQDLREQYSYSAPEIQKPAATTKFKAAGGIRQVKTKSKY